MQPTILPFVYAGRFSDDGGAVAYLTRGDKTIVAKAGDIIENEWKLLGLHDDRLDFEFIASGERLTLTIPIQK